MVSVRVSLVIKDILDKVFHFWSTYLCVLHRST